MLEFQVWRQRGLDEWALLRSLGTFFADVNGDGRADAIVVNHDKIVVRPANPYHHYFLGNQAWTQEAYYGTLGTFFADVTGNGQADANVVNTTAITVRRASQHITPPSPVLPPAAPSGLTITGKTHWSISLSWQDNATNEDGYRVERSQGGGSFVVAATLPAGTTGYTNGGLSASTAYCYRITAYNAAASSPSGQACTQTNAPPSSPADLAIVGAIEMVDSQGYLVNFPRPGQAISVVWRVCNLGNAAASGFTDLVQRNGSETFTFRPSTINPGACLLEYVHYPSGLAAGSHYWYVYLDYYNQVPELTETNNRVYRGITVQ